jgi:hypothetical protein
MEFFNFWQEEQNYGLLVINVKAYESQFSYMVFVLKDFQIIAKIIAEYRSMIESLHWEKK